MNKLINYATPIAICLSFLMIIGALYSKGLPLTESAAMHAGAAPAPAAGDLPVAPGRVEYSHLYGNPDAPTTIVEFSDLECPFCAELHSTLKRIVDTSDGMIKWEYRHLPLPNHRNAASGAVLSECIAKHIDAEAFWTFIDTAFQAGDGTLAFYEATAREVGLTDVQINDCRSDPMISERVRGDMAAARALGGTGTPHSIIVFKDGSTRTVRGALPYENWITLLSSE